jgi:thiol-disulfide isomerase/thioredoxin
VRTTVLFGQQNLSLSGEKQGTARRIPQMHSSPAPSPGTTPAARSSGGWWAVCLCADWCGTCREYRVIFDALARSHPHVRFEWVDIEDEAELAGDLDVEIFPTLLIADGASVRFLGALLPQVHVLARLLSKLQAGQAEQTAGADAQELLERVRAARVR